jgi:predicted nucleic acid-binding protein
MVVVADTSPLNYLVLIGEIELLPRLYNRILIPQAVMDELKHPAAPTLVSGFAAHPPAWLRIEKMDEPGLPQPGASIADLDSGELAAIILAEAHPNALLLMDEIAGRAEAARRGIRSIGTLGILRDAALSGLLDLAAAFQKLQTTSFRLPATIVAELLTQDSMRKKPSWL